MDSITFFCAICGSAISIASPDDWLVECPDCAHVVPVPAPMSATPEFAEALGVLPEGVLSLEVKFRCGACGCKLLADARFEGRRLACPECREEVQVPIWSRRSSQPGHLTAAEIDFLSGSPELIQPGVAAACANASG